MPQNAFYLINLYHRPKFAKKYFDLIVGLKSVFFQGRFHIFPHSPLNIDS